MDKYNAIVKVLDENIECTCGERFQIIGKYASAENILNLFTPNLQWKSEENTCYGGTVLLSRIHSVVNCDIDIQIYDPGDISPYVTWNGKHVFEGTLEECKQFCSDKILNDFLKLCE